MNMNFKAASYILSFTFVVCNPLRLHVLIAQRRTSSLLAITLGGIEIQQWFMDHFGSFATLPIPVHFASIISIITATILHGK